MLILVLHFSEVTLWDRPKRQTNNLTEVDVRPPGGCAIPTFENGQVMSPVTNETQSAHQLVHNGQRVLFVCQDTTAVGAAEAYSINGSITADPPRCASKDQPSLIRLILILVYYP